MCSKAREDLSLKSYCNSRRNGVDHVQEDPHTGKAALSAEDKVIKEHTWKAEKVATGRIRTHSNKALKIKHIPNSSLSGSL